MRHAMIMAGGAGTRLWPVSRGDEPKQLVPFIEREGGRRSLLRIAADRLEGLVPADQRLICTNERFRAQIRASIPSVGDAQILGEPVGRDTLNAVGFTAAVLHAADPDAVFAVLTADHLIEPEDSFRELLARGFDLVERDDRQLVTFSIKPTHAATGFGYVERGDAISQTDSLGFRVKRFVEKPPIERAQAYLAAGTFGWNSGMFVWKAQTFLRCLEAFAPDNYAGVMRIASAWGTPRQMDVLNEVYPSLPKTSVDFGIMEPATNPNRTIDVEVATVLMDLRWLDVGSWPSYAETLDADDAGNRVSGDGCAFRSADSLIVNTSPGHHVALLGCDDLIVVHTDRATLVMPRERAQELKDLHAGLPDELK